MRIRLLVTALVTMVAAVLWVPTLFPDHQATWIPSAPLELGLPFTEGLDLVLDVEVERPVWRTVKTHASLVSEDAVAMGLPMESVDHHDIDELTIVSTVPSTQIDALVAEVGAYERLDAEPGVHHYKLHAATRARIEDRAIEGAIDLIEARTRDLCLERAKVEQVGSDRVRVWLPGASDLHAPDCENSTWGGPG